MDLSLIVLTDRLTTRRPLLDVVAAALDAGARTFLLREKDLPASQRRDLADRMRALGADVIAGGADLLGGNAIHLSAADPLLATAAGDFAPGGRGAGGLEPLVVGRSCHAVAEVLALTGLTYCTLSPIFETASKPGYGPALGTAVLPRAATGGRASGGGAGVAPWQGVVALGGIDSPERAYECRAAGATGIAVMGAVMRADDPATVVKGLLA